MEMKKCIVILALMAMTACQQQKIGFVDNVRLMDEYREKIDIEKKFESMTQAHNQKRDSISQAFQMEAQAFQEKAQSMSQQKAQEEYGNLQQRGQRIGQQLQQEEQQMQQQGQTEMDSLISKVKDQISKYGKDNGYDYILGGGNGGSVLYGDENKDLTEEILKLLNDNYGK
jgi:outer membrane protein